MFVLLQFLGIKVTPYLFSELRISFDFGSTLQDLALYEVCHPEFPCGKITIEVRTEFVIYEKKKEHGHISQSEPSKLRARTCFTREYIRTEVNLR